MSSKSLTFELSFSQRESAERSVTTAFFGVFIDGEAVWPVQDAPKAQLEIQIDDLLSHFVECWQPLALRQTYPIAVGPARPTLLRAEAEKRWEQQPADVAEREDGIVADFENAHDISRCFAGYFDLPPLWLMRRGEKIIVDTRTQTHAVDFMSAWAEVSRLGDEIAGRIATAGERWSELVESWRNRDQSDAISLLAWSTSLERDAASAFESEGVLSAPESFAEAANDNDELRIAARMSSGLPRDQIRSILQIVKSFPKSRTPDFDKFANETVGYVDDRFANRRAHEQGEAAARFVREKSGLSATVACEIGELLRRHGIQLDFRSADPTTLRALAVYGDRRGPTVFINQKGRPGSIDRDPLQVWSSRVDMAHEYCHLLLDRGHALSAVEVLDSRMPVEIEQRAKSFAGALLLPTEAAAEAWRSHGSPNSLDQLRTLVWELQNSYGVTKSVASWKLQHATQSLGEDFSVVLNAIAPTR